MAGFTLPNYGTNFYQLGGIPDGSLLSGMRYGSDSLPILDSVVPSNTAQTGVEPQGFWGGLWDSMLDKKDSYGSTTQGWLSPVIGVAQGIGNAYMGMQQYGLAQDALKEQQRQFNLNYQAQRKMTNSTLEDRQRARIASNPTAYQSVGDYMKQYGV